MNKSTTYILISGEGENATTEFIKTDNIQAILKKERCNGDRYAHAYRDFFHNEWGYIGYDVDTNRAQFLPFPNEED